MMGGCASDETEIALALSDNNTPLREDDGDDFHFYRRHGTGLWTHKLGSSRVSNVDASGVVIDDPKTADRRYNKYNYHNFCSYYCL
jgi:hypothetical protein